jgi:HEAT repeat protein
VQLASRTVGFAACAARLGTLLALGLAAVGCANPGARMDRAAVDRLERRSLDLLLRAAESNLDVVAAHAMEALVDVAPREGQPASRAGLRSESPLVRFAACVATGRTRDGASLAAVNALRRTDADPRVRLGASYAAARLGESAAGRLLVDTLNDHPGDLMRADAAYLVGRLDEVRAVPWLERAARLEKSHRALVHIYAALAMLGKETAIDSLAALSRLDNESRVVAVQSLAELRHPRAREALLYRLKAEPEFLETRLIAARGLGALGSREGYDLAKQHLFDTYNDSDDAHRTHRIRALGALALGAVGDPAALPLLQRLAETETDERTQVAACYAIVQITTRQREAERAK